MSGHGLVDSHADPLGTDVGECRVTAPIGVAAFFVAKAGTDNETNGITGE